LGGFEQPPFFILGSLALWGEQAGVVPFLVVFGGHATGQYRRRIGSAGRECGDR